MKKDVQVIIIGKILVLNRTLNKYFRLVKRYLAFNSIFKKFLHENCYGIVKRLFNLNTPLIQTVRDNAVEVLKSFQKNKKGDSYKSKLGKAFITSQSISLKR